MGEVRWAMLTRWMSVRLLPCLIFVVGITGCGVGRDASFSNTPVTATVSLKQAAGSPLDSPSGAEPADFLARNVAYLILTVTASDIQSLQCKLEIQAESVMLTGEGCNAPLGEGTAVGVFSEIPPGSGRTFSVEAFGADDSPLASGFATSDLSGESRTIEIELVFPDSNHPVFNDAVDVAPIALGLGDMDGDGCMDQVVAYASGELTIRINNGKGQFSPLQPTLSVGGTPGSLALGDVNGDGKVDIVVANQVMGSFVVLMGMGNGFFAESEPHPVDGTPTHIALSDLDGDGGSDLVITDPVDHQLLVLWGDGTGNFTQNSPIVVTGELTSVAVGDVNKDLFQDVVVALDGEGLSLFLGDRDRRFGTAMSLFIEETPSFVAIGDPNQDDNPDLIVTGDTDNMLSILAGDGTGNFGYPVSFEIGTGPHSIQMGDMNCDGVPDIVATNQTSNNISMFLNFDPILPLPPVLAPPGTLIGITKTGSGEGMVESDPTGISCGVGCTTQEHRFPNGSTVTLIPTPETGSQFQGWTGPSDCADGVIFIPTDNAAFAQCVANFIKI